jgi:hypothetical protein
MKEKAISIQLHVEEQKSYIYKEGVNPSDSILPYFYKDLTFFEALEGIEKAFLEDRQFCVSKIYVIFASKNIAKIIKTENDTADTVSQKLYKIIKENKGK